MVNRYPASCRYCGGTIPPECGSIEIVGQLWRAAHPACVEANRNALAAFGYGSPATPAKRRTALVCLPVSAVFSDK